MATTTTRTRNLRLFLSSGLTAEARTNLEILDRLGDTTYLDASETITFRSKTDIVLQPGDENVNGTKNNGKLYLGTADNKIHTLEFWPATKAIFFSPISINNKLTFTTANTTDQTLTVNTGSGNRTLSLSGNLTVGHDITLTASAPASLTLVPGEQTLANTSTVQTFSNKVLDASCSIDLTGKVRNADISSSSAHRIEYSKLNLANSIKASDFTTSAGKLQYNQLDLENQLRNTDWSSNPAHKLAGTKVDTDFATQEVISSSFVSVRDAANGNKAKIRAPLGLPATYEFILPAQPGLVGQVLAMFPPDINNPTKEIPLGWVSVGTTILPTGNIYIGQNGTPLNVDVNNIAASEVAASVSTGLTLKATTVTSGSYGSATQAAQITVDTKGRLTAAANVAIDHDQLTNFVANEHIDHTTVSISPATNGGLSGGGDLSASRTLQVDPTAAAAKALPVGADTILLADSADSNSLKKATLADLSFAIGVQSFKANWVETDADPFTVTHNLNSLDTIVQIVDTANGETIGIQSITRTLNTVVVTAQNKPATFTWRILILKI